MPEEGRNPYEVKEDPEMDDPPGREANEFYGDYDRLENLFKSLGFICTWHCTCYFLELRGD